MASRARLLFSTAKLKERTRRLASSMKKNVSDRKEDEIEEIYKDMANTYKTLSALSVSFNKHNLKEFIACKNL